ncbi:DUF397 domain-containing protein [Streptomyces sp. NBC_00490]|uniref:DUF397 domain-containing protein n=1 Tax=Streptomyces sp. NBC_00490 TaxID=2903657 RepID=UPI002E191560
MSTEALQWFKSTYSGSEGGECLEVAYTWHKSSHTSDEGPHTIHVRDSKTPTGPTLQVTATAWSAFIATTV